MECISTRDCHEFIDQYDETETLPEDVIDMADDFSNSDEAAEILEAGKLKTRTYVLSYCKHCGATVERSDRKD